MMQCVATALIVLCGFLMFSHAKENLCPGGKANCPDDSTCCVLSNGSFGCCPIQNAVCCKDSVYCCPDGYTCDLIKGTCKNENVGEYIKGFHMSQTISALKTKVSAALNLQIVECPDGRHHCATFQTCCQVGPMSYKCCPMPNAVCCADAVHCCPDGFICDIMGRRCFPDKRKKRSEQINMIEEIQALKTSKGKCSKTDEHINTIENIPAIKTSSAGEYIKGLQTKEILRKTSALRTKISPSLHSQGICPGKKYTCEFDETCCRNNVGGWSCCPVPFATCCSDGIHCCPPGSLCGATSCVSSASVDTVFPDKKYQCLPKSTCCKRPSGTCGCCPLKSAVCCSDHKHCCPGGYTCDMEAGKCNKATEDTNVIENIPIIKTSIDAELKHTHCPDGCSCFDDETCSELADTVTDED